MSDWIHWLIATGGVVVLELFTGTFYLLMIALGLAAGALVAWLGASIALQLICAAVVGAGATLALRRSRFGRRARVASDRDPNINLDIGQTLPINRWQHRGGLVYAARAMHRGAQWDIECLSQDMPTPGLYRIIALRGSELIVEPVAH